MKKKIIGVVVAVVVVAGGVFYFTRPKPVITPPGSTDLGTRGGATQVNMETH